MNKNFSKIFFPFIILITLLLPPSFAQSAPNNTAPQGIDYSNQDTATDYNPPIDYAKGRVLQILSQTQNRNLEQYMKGDQALQITKVKVLNGKYKNKILTINNYLSGNPAYDINLKKGDRVLLDVEKENGKIDFFISDKDREPALYIILGLFFTSVLIVGGTKGLKSLLSVLITTASVFFILLPLILSGFPAIPAAVIVSIISTLATMLLVGGFNKKSFAAASGTILSLSIAGILALLAIKFASLTGFAEQESIMLLGAKPFLNFKGILAASIIIASLGAVMDIGISIASCIAEFKNVNEAMTRKDLIQSGMNVGKDIIGAMSNTLILAYIGSALPLILLATNAPYIKIINLNSIATEIASALIGSIGIVLCVPITAVIASYFIGKDQKSDSPN